MTFNSNASSTQLQAGAVPGVSMAPLGLSRRVRCVWQETKALAPPAPCTDERATACAMFVERSNGSSSNYHHSNYRITPSTKCVQETKCISLDTSWALGTDSREQALPSLAGLPRHCFQESQRLRSDWSSPVPPVPSSPLSSTLYPLYTQLPDGLCSFLLPNL